jgi:hypothetical protein
MTSDMSYDRTAPELLSLLEEANGFLGELLSRCALDLVDLHVRRHPFSNRQWVSLYVGMTSVLDIAWSGGQFRVSAHPTHRKNGGFDQDWLRPMSPADLTARSFDVLSYVDRVIPTVGSRHTAKEGRVHAALCSGASDAFAVADREAAVGFRDSNVKSQICDPISDAIHSAVLNAGRKDAWWPGNGPSLKRFGTGLDILAAGPDGQIFAIEAKPAGALDGIMWGPAQVRFYAEVFAAWAYATPAASAIIDSLTEQRVRLGLSTQQFPVAEPITVVPVLAIGYGKLSPQAMPRANAVREVIDGVPAGNGVGELEVWTLNESGHPVERH